MRNIIKQMASVWILVGIVLTSCNDWTDPESLRISEPSIENQNPELYAAYLENLRNYKERMSHKKVYGYFDNTNKQPVSQAELFTAVPDSVDALILTSPILMEDEIMDMNKVRTDKGTDFFYSLDFDALKVAYNTKIDVKDKEAEPASKDFISHLLDTVPSLLSLLDVYGYDGIVIKYAGKSQLHMSDETYVEYVENENAFMGLLKSWYGRRGNVRLIFEGNPKYVIDRTIIKECELIIVNSTNALEKSRLTMDVLSAIAEDIPDDRFVIAVSAPNLSDKKAGYFSDGTLAITGAADWLSKNYEDFTAVGLCIYNISNDYYNISRIYSNVRNTISIINPPIKNY